MKKAFRILARLFLLAGVSFAQIPFPQNASPIAHQGGTYYASGYATWSGRVISGNAATGSQSIVIAGNAGGGAGGLQLADGTTVSLQTVFSTLTPVIVDYGQAAQESVTPTAVSVGQCPAGNLGVGGGTQCVTLTGSFSNTHGQSAIVIDGSYGLQTAINYAQQLGGGTVVLDSVWSAIGGTNAMVTAALPYASVSIEDLRGVQQNWNAVGGATTLAAPATLTATTVGFGLNGANTTGGAYTGTSTYHVCVAYVDIMGQEGPCSADFSGLTAGTGSTNQIGFSAPAASTGAVGYTVYISLASGSYSLSYKVPLVSQPTAVGAYPASNGVCTLTKVELITPACALANTTYNQLGSAAIVSALTLNTSPINPQVTVVSTTSVYVPNAGGRTTYAYAPASKVGVNGAPFSILPFTISAADATTVPSVLGTINLAPGFMNNVGRTLEICGYATTTASTGTIKDIQFQWDSMGQNTAGKGVQIGDLTVTQTSTSVTQLDFCERFQTTVAGAGATAGTIQTVGGYLTSSIASLSAAAAGGNTQAGGVASLNLAADARINIIYVHTTGTDGAALTLQGVTVRSF
jgi:hypothetical protein